MALVKHQMTVIGHQIGHLTSAHETLDQRDIDDACWFAPAAADDPDMLRIDIKECLEALNPLGEQLSAMDKDQRIARPRGDKRGGHDRLAEGCGCRQHAGIMRHERVERLYLRAI